MSKKKRIERLPLWILFVIFFTGFSIAYWLGYEKGHQDTINNCPELIIENWRIVK